MELVDRHFSSVCRRRKTMEIIPKTFKQAVNELEKKLSFAQKEELKCLPFISINVMDKTDFFDLVITSFQLNGENNELLADISKENVGAVINENFLAENEKADAVNGARLILENIKENLS